jgi:hypothetical protein
LPVGHPVVAAGLIVRPGAARLRGIKFPASALQLSLKQAAPYVGAAFATGETDVPRYSLPATALALALLPLAPAAQAQDAPGEKVNQLIVFGDDPCPASQENEITVCARKDESERYRIPQALREEGDLQKNESWNNKVLAYETVGAAGTLSCSPVGPAGWTGCADKLIKNAFAQRAEASDIRFSELIAAEREKRLATIDEDAAATQSRVEQAEREYAAREAAEGDAAPLPPRGDEVNIDAGNPGQ